MKAAALVAVSLLTATSQGAASLECKVNHILNAAQRNVIARAQVNGDHKPHGCKPENLVFRRE